MLSDDMFRTALAPIVAGLEAWADTLAGVAAVEHGQEGTFWRLALQPIAPAACPVEIIVHQRQTYDVGIGPESYEDLPLEDLGRLLPLLQAVAAGRVVTRSWTTLATGALGMVETIVEMDVAGRSDTWQRERVLLGPNSAGVRATGRARDRHYAPYDRAAATATAR